MRALAALLALSLSACSLGQTRLSFGLAVIADAGTTGAALNMAHARETNPTLKAAPVPIMLALSAIVALVAEHHVRNGEITKARNLYALAATVHGLAALWNGYQGARYGRTDQPMPSGITKRN